MKIFKLFIVVLFVTTFAGCFSSNNDFRKGKVQLETQGYTNVTRTGYPFFCCSEEDGFATGFKAKDKSGRTVKGCFCSGVMKGVTIRF